MASVDTRGHEIQEFNSNNDLIEILIIIQFNFNTNSFQIWLLITISKPANIIGNIHDR